MLDIPEAVEYLLSDTQTERTPIRLLMVANNAHLHQILKLGTEVHHLEAALKLRAHSTCPMFYSIWDYDSLQKDVVIRLPVPQHNHFGSSVSDVAKLHCLRGMMPPSCVPAERRNRRGGHLERLSGRVDPGIVEAPVSMRNVGRLPLLDGDDASSSPVNGGERTGVRTYRKWSHIRFAWTGSRQRGALSHVGLRRWGWEDNWL